MKNGNKVGSSFLEDMFLEEIFDDHPKLDRIVTLQMETPSYEGIPESLGGWGCL